MYIDTIRICGHEQPMGMALDPLTISWKVRDAVGKNAAQESLVVAMDPGMQDVVWEKSGADLPVSLATISETAPDGSRGKMLGFSDILWVVGILAAYGTGVAVSKGIGDLFKNKEYALPFIALIIFYIGTNVPANTLGQFSTWVAMNVIHLEVWVSSLICMLVYPARALLDIVFMKYVDTDKRMPLFYIGAALYLAGFLMFPIFGFNMVTFILTQLLYCMGAAFAFESILKVWMQECFPTLLRTTANGAIVFSSRLCCAAFGLFTASIISFNVKFAFILLALFCVIGFASAILVFRKRRYNTFEEEEAAVEVAETTEAK